MLAGERLSVEVPGDPNRTSYKNAIPALDSMRFARVPGNGRRPLRSTPDEAIGTRLCPQAGTYWGSRDLSEPARAPDASYLQAMDDVGGAAALTIEPVADG